MTPHNKTMTTNLVVAGRRLAEETTVSSQAGRMLLWRALIFHCCTLGAKIIYFDSDDRLVRKDDLIWTCLFDASFSIVPTTVLKQTNLVVLVITIKVALSFAASI